MGRRQFVLCRSQTETSQGRPNRAGCGRTDREQGRSGQARPACGAEPRPAGRCPTAALPARCPRCALRLPTWTHRWPQRASGEDRFSAPGPLLVGVLSSPSLPSPPQASPCCPCPDKPARCLLPATCCWHLASGGCRECPGGLGAPGPPFQSSWASGCGVGSLWTCWARPARAARFSRAVPLLMPTQAPRTGSWSARSRTVSQDPSPPALASHPVGAQEGCCFEVALPLL